MSTLVTVRSTLSEIYPATPKAVSRARAAVCRYAEAAGASPEQLDAIRLAVSEAATNCARHAYRERTDGAFEVSAAVAEGELWVLVSDQGCGFHTPALSPGLGLGLALIAEAADEFEIHERGTGGTAARMPFRLHEHEPASSG